MLQITFTLVTIVRTLVPDEVAQCHTLYKNKTKVKIKLLGRLSILSWQFLSRIRIRILYFYCCTQMEFWPKKTITVALTITKND